MSSSAAKAVPGKPFKPGHDPRRNPTGAASRERAAWTNLFLNHLAERLDPEAAADILATAYEAKRPWAITEVHERLMGKVTQPLGGDKDNPVPIRLIYENANTGTRKS